MLVMTSPTPIQESPPTVPDVVLEIEPRRIGGSLASRFSGALAAVAAITTAIAVFFSSVFGDAPMTAGNARGTALVILVVAIPTLLGGMALTRRGHLWGRVLWLGALAYITYNAVFFAYAVHFSRLFLLSAAMLSLGVWSIVTALRETAPEAFRRRLAGRLPVRAIAGYLLVTTALFTALWLKDILPAIAGGVAPASLKRTGMVTNAIEMTDLAFGFPLTALAGVWLWQRRAWGYVLAGMYLVYGVIEAISVATDQTFGHLRDGSHSIAVVPAFAVLALIELVPAVVFLRSLRRGPISIEREDPASTS
jgi:hypothetical protein